MLSTLRRALVGLSLLALAAGLTPASASHTDHLPHIAGQTGVGAAWRSFTFTTDGSEYAIDIASSNVTNAATASWHMYSATNEFLGGTTFNGFPPKNGELVRIGNGDDVNVNTQSSGAGMLFRMSSGFNNPAAGPLTIGTRKIVLWWASDGATWDWSFRAAPGTSIDATDGGSSAYLVQSQDFTSAGHAEAQQGSTNARASVVADHVLGVRDTLIGYYRMGTYSAGTLTVTTPSGEKTCGITSVVQPLLGSNICVFSEMQGTGRNGAGTYTFHTTSAGPGLVGTPGDVWFGGADARLPA